MLKEQIAKILSHVNIYTLGCVQVFICTIIDANKPIFVNFYLFNRDFDSFVVISQVHAKHEEKTESKSVYREYNREFLLPKGTNPELIKSSLSKDGVLTVEAPLPAIASGEKLIPIQH